MGNIFSNNDQQQQASVTAVAAAAERLRLLQRQREAEQERQRQRQRQEAEQERHRQELERERERLLQHAKAQAALRLYPRRPLLTPSYYDKYNSYDDDKDWEWHFDRAQAYNDVDGNDDALDDQGYTGSDGYYRIPQHNHLLHRPQTQGGNERGCLGQKKTDKAYTPPSGKGRRKRGRKGKGDLYENDYHAGLTKSEILAMSSERKAAFEVQKLRRQHQHESVVSA